MFNYTLLISAIILVCIDFTYLSFFKNMFGKQVQHYGVGFYLH